MATVDKKEVERLLEAEHGDPFCILGPHTVSVNASEFKVVRAFLPHARRAWLVIADEQHPMEMAHRKGFFETSLPSSVDLSEYRLRIETYDGRTDFLDDPYSFPPVLTDFDLHLLKEGTHCESYKRLGAHPMILRWIKGTLFAVWAPNALRVSVVGDFNNWDGRRHPMRNCGASGVWELFIPGVSEGCLYKYEIRSRHARGVILKADPYGFAHEVPPRTASVVHGLKDYDWNDAEWMRARASGNPLDKPISIYEVHAGSFRRVPEEGDRYLTYREMADTLVPYAKSMGFTHIELLPVTEHPFDGSWGYQTVGYYAPTSRFGTPEDFKALVDRCHRSGLGVILDWVPAHFPTDSHGLSRFDGTCLYEYEDPRKGVHQEWGTLIFNLGRIEVRNFLASNALYWLKEFHVDGLRVDAVASMIYLDYSRKPGEWVPNRFGGKENLESVGFLKYFNTLVHRECPGILTIAEESTAWPMVSRPVYLGGLGFSLKWNMGWMHDMLVYISKDPVHRKYHHNNATFALLYAFTENFVLVLSHDEVVHGKASLLSKMPGDFWQKFANLRVFFGYMFCHPGKKLLFMGGEFGQWGEWNHDRSLDWYLPGALRGATCEARLVVVPGTMNKHQQLQGLVRELNHLYSSEPALCELDFDPMGFEWIDCNDSESNVLSFLRYARDRREFLVCIFNFTPIPRHGYRMGVPEAGWYSEVMNSDSQVFGGSNMGNLGGVQSEPVPWHRRPFSLKLCLPPLSTLIFKRGARHRDQACFARGTKKEERC